MFALIDLTDPARPTNVGTYPTKREAYGAALRLKLPAFQVRPVKLPCPR